jgi:hypothetical protein
LPPSHRVSRRRFPLPWGQKVISHQSNPFHSNICLDSFDPIPLLRPQNPATTFKTPLIYAPPFERFHTYRQLRLRATFAKHFHSLPTYHHYMQASPCRLESYSQTHCLPFFINSPFSRKDGLKWVCLTFEGVSEIIYC